MTNDAVQPKHYDFKPSPIEVIEGWGLGFHLGCALKYVARAGKKTPGDVLTDLKKARWYLDRAVNHMVNTHRRANHVSRGDYTTTALAAAGVWGLGVPLLNVVVMIANAASSSNYSDAAADLRSALDNLDKAIAGLEGR